MSLNKTLDRLFDEIRREAKRNPDFAGRLDAVMRAHTSRRDVDEALIDEVSDSGPPASSRQETSVEPVVASPPIETPHPEINPVGLYQREGEEALAAILLAHDRPTLLALMAEHNLDPGGEAGELDRDALAAHVLAQAKRRAERDSKLFDY